MKALKAKTRASIDRRVLLLLNNKSKRLWKLAHNSSNRMLKRFF